MSAPTATPPARVADPERLRVLARTGLLDGPAVAVLDRLTSLATRVLGAPVALVSLVDAERQFFVSAVGLPEPWAQRRQTPLTHSFCQYVVASDAPLVITDARADDLLCTNLAIPDIGVIAYAGFPLRSPDGQPLGSFCVIDTQPREWTPADLAVIADLAAAAESEIAVRLSQARLLREMERSEAILSTSSDAYVSADAYGTVRLWNASAERLFGWTASEVAGQSLSELIIPEGYREAHEAGLRRVREGGVSTVSGRRLELAALHRDGREFPVEMVLQAQPTEEGLVFHAFLHDISERHRVRRELENERTFLASLLDSLETGVAACDADGQLVLFNRALREQDGDLATDPTHGVYAADGLTPLAPEDVPLTRAFQGEAVHHAELVVRRPGRPPRQYLANAQPIRASDGRRLGAVVALHDVTAAVRTEQLREMQHAVTTTLADAGSTADAAARTASAVAAGLGWAHGEYWQLGKDEPVLTRIGAWTAPGRDGADLAVGAGEFAARVHTAAQPVWLPSAPSGAGEALGLPVRSGEGALGVLVFLHDGPMACDADLLSRLDGVSAHLGRFVERRRAEAARRAFERVVSGIDDYVWTAEIAADGATRVLYGSPNGANVFGTEPGRSVRLNELVHRDDVAAFASFHDVIRSGRPSELEARFVGADGGVHWVWTRAVPRRRAGRLLVDGICTDVTERHRISEARDELVALVTHELRSPITSIRGYLELVFDAEDSCTAEADRFLRIVDRKVADLQQLTDDLLDLARLDAGEISVEPRPVSLAQLLADVITDHRPAAESKDLTVDVEVDGPVEASVDPTRFRQVLTNLLSNAVKYTPDGGRVEVRAGVVDGAVSITVADTGIGIPADQYPRLFERFFRTSNAVQLGIKGTGLGLAITRAIIERHGGTIAAHPGTPHGTVFTITLPGT